MSTLRTPREAKAHFWMIAAKVVFVEEGTEETRQGEFNGIVKNTLQIITTKKIAEAQQAAQQMFYNAVGPEYFNKVKIVDVVILNFSYLGYMTNSEFADMPVPDNSVEQVMSKAGIQ